MTDILTLLRLLFWWKKSERTQISFRLKWWQGSWYSKLNIHVPVDSSSFCCHCRLDLQQQIERSVKYFNMNKTNKMRRTVSRDLEMLWGQWRSCRGSAAGSPSWPPPAPPRFCHVVLSDCPHEPPWARLPGSLEPPNKDRKSKTS